MDELRASEASQAVLGVVRTRGGSVTALRRGDWGTSGLSGFFGSPLLGQPSPSVRHLAAGTGSSARISNTGTYCHGWQFRGLGRISLGFQGPGEVCPTVDFRAFGELLLELAVWAWVRRFGRARPAAKTLPFLVPLAVQIEGSLPAWVPSPVCFRVVRVRARALSGRAGLCPKVGLWRSGRTAFRRRRSTCPGLR